QAELWLGGLDPNSLAAFNTGAILSAVDSQGREQGRVQLERREGLVGKAKLLDRVPPGALLQERSRNIPPNLALKIGLDPSLSSDAGTAKQAITAIPRMEALPLQTQEVHYIFGRMTSAYLQQLQSVRAPKLPEVGSLGLFTPALEVIPDSFGMSGETVKNAIARLHSKLNSLLAAHIIKTALNTNSSRLKVVASMQVEGGGKVIADPFTTRGGSLGKQTSPISATPTISPDSRKLPLRTPVQILVTNNEPNDLYFSVLVIDPTGEMSVVFPNHWTAAEEVTLVKAGEIKEIPNPKTDNFRLVTQEPKGVAEVLILASRTPLRKGLKTLRDIVATRSDTTRGGPVTLETSPEQNEAGEVIDNLLDDFTSSTRGSVRNSTRSSDSISESATSDRSIETNQLAALSITFEVI
ncbi:MAG: DUF4384 domain-containing protein, partial [Cyanobacteriota bacterium]